MQGDFRAQRFFDKALSAKKGQPLLITVGLFKGCMIDCADGYFVISAEMLRAKLVGSSTGSPAIKRACW